MRARLNLLAAGVGARLEVDLWPHLRGLTACVMADPHAPGSPTGALVVLHLDGERSADRIATDVLPRLARLSTGLRPSAAPPGQAAPGEPRRIGVAAGKPLAVARRGNDALLAWGTRFSIAPRTIEDAGSLGCPPVCDLDDSRQAGPSAPGCVLAGPLLVPGRTSDVPPPAWQVLADGPPVVWWGWDAAAKLRDTIVYPDLRATVHRFLENVPLDPARLP